MQHPILEIYRSHYIDDMAEYVSRMAQITAGDARRVVVDWIISQADDENSDDTDTTPFDPLLPYSSANIDQGLIRRFEEIDSQLPGILHGYLLNASRRAIDELNDIQRYIGNYVVFVTKREAGTFTTLTLEVRPISGAHSDSPDYVESNYHRMTAESSYRTRLSVRLPTVTYNRLWDSLTDSDLSDEEKELRIFTLLTRCATTMLCTTPNILVDDSRWNITHEAYSNPISRDLNLSFSDLTIDSDRTFGSSGPYFLMEDVFADRDYIGIRVVLPEIESVKRSIIEYILDWMGDEQRPMTVIVQGDHKDELLLQNSDQYVTFLSSSGNDSSFLVQNEASRAMFN